VRVFNRRITAVVCDAVSIKQKRLCRRNSPMSLSGWRILAGRLFQSRGPRAGSRSRCNEASLNCFKVYSDRNHNVENYTVQ